MTIDPIHNAQLSTTHVTFVTSFSLLLTVRLLARREQAVDIVRASLRETSSSSFSSKFILD